MKIILLWLALAGSAVAQTWFSTTGSTIGELNLQNAATTSEYRLLITTGNGVQQLGASIVDLWSVGNQLYGETQGGSTYSISTSALVTDQNGQKGYLVTTTTAHAPSLSFTIRVSPSPAEILLNGVNYASLPNASSTASLDWTSAQLYAEDGNNTLYQVRQGVSRAVGRSTTQGNITAITTISTPEPQSVALAMGGLLLLAATMYRRAVA